MPRQGELMDKAEDVADQVISNRLNNDVLTELIFIQTPAGPNLNKDFNIFSLASITIWFKTVSTPQCQH